MRNDLQIKYKDDLVQGDLYVTAIELTNAGRASIKSDDFDSGRAVQFSLDTKIIKHLSTEHSPKSAPAPGITANESQFSLAPELIAKGEVIKFALLTEGRPKKAETSFSPFGEVSIEISDREVAASRRARQTRIAFVALPVLLTAMVIFETLLVIKEGNQSSHDLNSLININTCDSLANDSDTAVGILRVLQEQTATLENSTTVQSAQIRPYSTLARLAESELLNMNGTYNTLSAFGVSLGSAADMIPFTIKAASTLGEAAKSTNKEEISSFAKQLSSMSTRLISSSIMPSGCLHLQ